MNDFKWKTPSDYGIIEAGQKADTSTTHYISTSDMYGQICMIVNLLNRISFDRERITYSFEVSRYQICLARFIYEPDRMEVKDREELFCQYYTFKLTEAEERKVVKTILLKLTEIVTEMGVERCGD